MLWDFGSTDDGAAVAAILNTTRGYEGRVTYAANPTKTDTVVGVSSFTGWEGYQVVHVATHGTQLCTDGQCRAVILASTLQAEAPEGKGISTLSEIKAGLGQRGLETAKIEGSRGLELELDYVVLSADFFRSQYPGGLEDTFIFFNACETSGGATDMGDALRGTTSVFLGWDEAVSLTTAPAAAVALYTDLAEGGYPADTAFDRLSGALKTDSVLPEHAQLVLSDRKDGDQLRIRDVVELLDPEGALLEATSAVPIIGQQDDGEEDLAPYTVQVDGMTPEIAGGAMLHVSIDGVESDPQPITDGTSNEMDQWLVSGEIPLGYDLEDDKVVDFRAWVELPGGGESDDETPGTLTGSEPIMGYEWEYVGTNELGFPGGRLQISSATLTLEFEEGQVFDEPHPRYVITGGTVTYGPRDGSALGCTYSGGGASYAASSDASKGALVFDTTVTPVEFRGVLSTSGVDDTVTQDCSSIGPGYGVNTVNYGPNTVWMVMDSGEELAVTDREHIDANLVYPSEYGYRHVFTITRIR